MMTSTSSSPPFARQLADQIRIIGYSLRREAMVFGLVLLLLSVVGLLEAADSVNGLAAEPELLLAALPLAALLPLAVWRGEYVFGEAFLWLKPVSRQRAALIKVLAGSFWLMVTMLIILAWILLISAISGGSIGVTEQRYIGDPAAPAQLQTQEWASPLWLWTVPLLSGLILYLSTSAIVIGVKRPLRMIAAILFGIAMLITFVLAAIPNGVVEHSLAQAQFEIVNGRYGLTQALTAGVSGSATNAVGPGGQEITVWRELPSFDRWAPAMLLWLIVGIVSLALAIGRHRESTS